MGKLGPAELKRLAQSPGERPWSLGQTGSVWPALGLWATAEPWGKRQCLSAWDQGAALATVLGSTQSLLDAKTEMGPAVYSTKAFYSFKNQPLGLFCRY